MAVLIWACGVYAAIWLIVSIVFFWADRAWVELSGDGKKSRDGVVFVSALGSLGLGLAWPLVLAVFIYLFFCSIMDR